MHTDAAGHKHKQTLLATDMLSRGEKIIGHGASLIAVTVTQSGR